MRQLSNQAVGDLKLVVFVVCLIPLGRLAVAGLTEGLGANPIEAITRSTGQWALRFLLITLAVTPVRRLTGYQWIARLRRTVALYAFFYACLHVLTYIMLDQFFDWDEIVKDVTKRPYIIVGTLAFLLLVPLAVTSTNRMMKRMGGRNWQRLHRLVYPIAAAGVLHYFWLVKRDISGPAVYIIILAVLLCARMVERRKLRVLPETALKREVSPPSARA